MLMNIYLSVPTTDESPCDRSQSPLYQDRKLYFGAYTIPRALLQALESATLMGFKREAIGYMVCEEILLSRTIAKKIDFLWRFSEAHDKIIMGDEE